MIEIQNLSRCRAGQQILRDVTLRIRNGTEAGNFCALIGSAGAGKTTLLEMMAGCIRPDGGTVQISGYDIVRQPREAKKQIGYLPQGMKPPADMTVWEYLDFVAGAKRLRGENAVRQIAAVCRQTAVTDVQDKRIGALPDIVCRRVALAQTLLGKPEFLLLDDPAEGLDAAQSAGLYRLIREIGAGRTVVAAGRPTSGLHTWCDRIILLDRGRVTAEKDAAALRRDAAPAGLVLHLTAKGDPEGVAEALRGIAGVQEAVGTEEQPGVATVTVRLSPEMSGANRDVRDEIFFTMAEKRYTLLSMEAEEQSAEELFASLTKEGEA